MKLDTFLLRRLGVLRVRNSCSCGDSIATGLGAAGAGSSAGATAEVLLSSRASRGAMNSLAVGFVEFGHERPECPFHVESKPAESRDKVSHVIAQESVSRAENAGLPIGEEIDEERVLQIDRQGFAKIMGAALSEELVARSAFSLHVLVPLTDQIRASQELFEPGAQ